MLKGAWWTQFTSNNDGPRVSKNLIIIMKGIYMAPIPIRWALGALNTNQSYITYIDVNHGNNTKEKTKQNKAGQMDTINHQVKMPF